MLSTTVKNIIRRLVPLCNALQDFGPSRLVKKAHYLGNNTVIITKILQEQLNTTALNNVEFIKEYNEATCETKEKIVEHLKETINIFTKNRF